MKLRLIWVTGWSTPQKIAGVFFCLLTIGLLMHTLRSSDTDTYTPHIVKRGDISENIIISGNANASGNASVYSPSTGVVTDMYVKNGDSVIPGQELMRIQSTAMETDRANALAAYQSAQAALNVSKQTKLTNQSLLEAGRKTVIDASISRQQMTTRRNDGTNNPATAKPYTQEEIDSINSSYESAAQSFAALEKKYLDSDSAIAAAQSAVSAAWLSYQSTLNGIIRSPIAGTVINLAVSPGDYVTAKTASIANQTDVSPVLRISNAGTISIQIKLNEVDVAKVRSGQSATVVFDAFPEKTFAASVSRVDTVGVNTNAVVTYNAFIDLLENDDRIRPAMTATVTIQTDTKKNVLLVPNIGLTKNKDQISVRGNSGKVQTIKPVTIGIKNTKESEITGGLSEGDVILVPKTK